MKQAHFLITTTTTRVTYRGLFMIPCGDAQADFWSLKYHASQARLIPVKLLHYLGNRYADYGHEPAELDKLQRLLWAALQAWSPPGFEFTAWFLNGRTVWGWFPRTG